MGCNGSKSTGTTDSQQQQGDQPEHQYYLKDEAVKYLMEELGITEDRAKKMVEKANTYKDNKVQKSEMETLRKEVIEIKQEVVEMFVKYDSDTSGTVTMEEGMTVLKEKFPGVNEDSLKVMLKRYDQNNTGKIEYKEFVYFYANVKYKREDLKLKFQELDKNVSGTLSSHEATQLLVEECALSEYMARSLFEDFDLDKDGSLNKTEFEQLFLSLFG